METERSCICKCDKKNLKIIMEDDDYNLTLIYRSDTMKKLTLDIFEKIQKLIEEADFSVLFEDGNFIGHKNN